MVPLRSRSWLSLARRRPCRLLYQQFVSSYNSTLYQRWQAEHRHCFHLIPHINVLIAQQLRGKRVNGQLTFSLCISASLRPPELLSFDSVRATLLSHNKKLCNDSHCHCKCISLHTLTSSKLTLPPTPSPALAPPRAQAAIVVPEPVLTTTTTTTPTPAPLTNTVTTNLTKTILTEPIYRSVTRTQLRNCHRLPLRSFNREMSKVTEYRHRHPVTDAPTGLFRGEVDRFNGITVISKDEYCETTDFVDKLDKSLAYWQKIGRRAIWFLIANEHSEWIPHLTQNKFIFHHVQDGMVALYRWLAKEPANVPHFCHHMLGVGGLVINDKDEILVVSDLHGMIPGSWKLPGGYVDPGENIVEAAIREVREETNIECTFRTMIAFRHSHGSNFGCSDIYMVAALRPVTSEIRKCEREIAKAEWMPISKYLDHPNVHQNNREFVKIYLDYKKRGLLFTCIQDTHKVLNKKYNLYYLASDEQTECSD